MTKPDTEIITKEQKFWEDVKSRAKENIEEDKKNTKASQRMIKACDVMINLEKSNSKD